jgi:uncharacterized protein (DUF305 family)
VVGLALIAGLATVATVVVRAAQPGRDQPSPGAVEIGFAQDMRVHHQQAVLMAAYTREHAGTQEVRLLAGAIDSAQQREIGQMIGWLQSWGRPLAAERPAMAWMDDDAMPGMHHGSGAASMPGMASPAEMDALVNLTGKALDIRFLQLMTRHHQGGLPMAKYAATHSKVDYVRDAARSMILDQQREIDQMVMLLEARKATPLPPPR